MSSSRDDKVGKSENAQLCLSGAKSDWLKNSKNFKMAISVEEKQRLLDEENERLKGRAVVREINYGYLVEYLRSLKMFQINQLNLMKANLCDFI